MKMAQPSEVIKKPTKLKGTPEMKQVAENECWEDFLAIVDGLTELSALDLIAFHANWYLKVGHNNLCKFYIAALRAHAEVMPKTPDPA